MNVDARVVISELERSIKATKDVLLIRVKELRRVKGMKRFFEMGIKKVCFLVPFVLQGIERWSIGRELAQLSHERAEARAQVELREQTRAIEMVNGTEKARMEIGELRNELKLLTTSRDDAISRANEGHSKT